MVVEVRVVGDGEGQGFKLRLRSWMRLRLQ
ncbi:hypothetical protein A2U01_0055044, partial [Trifolium medium]|nr:hypothetical protein [Trifolium medium]